MSTRDFSLGRGGRCVWLTTYHPCSAETSRKSGALTYPEPLGPPRPVAGDLYFTLFYFSHFTNSYACVVVIVTAVTNQLQEMREGAVVIQFNIITWFSGGFGIDCSLRFQVIRMAAKLWDLLRLSQNVPRNYTASEPTCLNHPCTLILSSQI